MTALVLYTPSNNGLITVTKAIPTTAIVPFNPVKNNVVPYSTSASNNVTTALNPWFVTGLIDGDGNFTISVKVRNNNKLGFLPSLNFNITILGTEENIILLEKLNEYFLKTGVLNVKTRYVSLTIESQTGQQLVRDHFKAYPLQTIKGAYFDRWSDVLTMILNKDHQTKKGLDKIVSLKSGFPKGLSIDLQNAFPHIEINPIVYTPLQGPLDGHWIAGFVTADGHFSLKFRKMDSMKLGYTGQPTFKITQHIRDIVLQGRIDTFSNGLVLPCYSGRDRTDFAIWDQGFIRDILIPFFHVYPLHGTKERDFKDWIRGFNIMINRGHLTVEGQAELKEISIGMNSGRQSSRLIDHSLDSTKAARKERIENNTQNKGTTKYDNIYVYENNLLVNNKPFRTMADAAEYMKVNVASQYKGIDKRPIKGYIVRTKPI